jgi:hypothetical protein
MGLFKDWLQSPAEIRVLKPFNAVTPKATKEDTVSVVAIMKFNPGSL